MKLSQPYLKALSYDDVFIIPKFSTIQSRQDVDISTQLGKHKIPVPVIASNMDTVMNQHMCTELNKSGALGALHRFQTIPEAVHEFKMVQAKNHANDVDMPVFVSVGVNRDSHERAQELYKNGARHFVIDIAHGHSASMASMIAWMHSEFGTENVFLMAGNVATEQGAADLFSWGANAVKVGVGPGSVCKTKNITGVTVPILGSITGAVVAAKRAEQQFSRPFNVVADGGCLEIGDICKAIGAGADLVMSGRFFAGCPEAPQGTMYRGSASQEVQVKYRTDRTSMPTPEGTTEYLDDSVSAAEMVKLIAGGLRSAYSYVNARNRTEFHERCEFGTRLNR